MYLFISLNTNEGYFCQELIWFATIEIGKRNGWEPAGTRYDFSYAIDNNIDEYDDILIRKFTMIIINNQYIEWKGDYFEKANQIITDEDAISLYNALLKEQKPDIRRLLPFIKMGAFRILDY